MFFSALRWPTVAGCFALCLVLAAPTVHGSAGTIIDDIDIPAGMSAEFIRDENDVAIIDFDGNFDRHVNEAEPNAAARAVIAREFYEYHADTYDFLFFFSLFDYEMGDAVAFHLAARNDVQGIGKPLYDNSAKYGSDGRLLGTIDMGPVLLDETKTDPTSAFHENLLNTTMHEMLHQWGIFVTFIDPETGQRSNALLGQQDAHWSPLVHTGGSVEYGAKWLDNADGTFTAVAERLFYSPMDLYLMGMAAPEEVPPFFLIEHSQPPLDPKGLSALGETVSGHRKNITVADVIAAEGPRQPSWQDSQKSFDAAFILVKRPGQAIPPRVYGRINTLRANVARRFSILTGGRGLMHVYSRARPVASVGEGQAATSDAGEREGEYRLGDALTWLRTAQKAGHWQDTKATSLRDSLLADQVLSDLDPLYVDSARIAFRAWLGAVMASDNDARARLVAGQAARADALIRTLIEAQHPDGGWGLTARHGSSPLDTALVLGAMRIQGGDPQAVGRAMGYLLATQNGDGGWPAVAGGDSQAGITARALRGLHHQPETRGVRQAAAAWLGARQNSDGSIGEGANRIADTARVLAALADTGWLEYLDVTAAVGYLKDHQGANGSWDNSVFNTAAAVQAMGRVQFGNWAVTGLRADTDTLHDGQRLSLTATIMNDGTAPTPSTTVALYLGDPTNGGVLIDTVVLPGIGIGQGVAVSFGWDSFNQAGERKLYVVVDPDNQIEERTDLDNSVELPVTVTPPASGVDLIASRIDMMPAAITLLPTDVGLSAVIRNAGKQPVDDATLQWWVDDGDGSELLHQESVSLPARGDRLLSISYHWEAAGTRTFRVILDPDGVLDEASEGNNIARLTVSPELGLDLAIGAGDIELLNTPAYGQTLKARAWIRNRGTVASPTFLTEFFLEDSEGQRIDLNSVEMTLEAGASRALDIPWTVDRTGDFDLVARIDPGHQVAELSRDNNEARRALTARVVDGVNPKVSHETFSFQPQPLLEGLGATLRVAVENTGNQPAANVKVRFWDGKPGAGGTLIDETTVPDIAPMASALTTGIWREISGSGERTLYAVVDPDGSLDEFDENDNTAFRVVNVGSLPDLALTDGAVILSPPLVAQGEAFTATIKVTNLGSQETDDFIVAAYWDSVNAQNRIAEKTLRLGGFAEHTLKLDLIAEGAGERQLHLVLDSGESVIEQQEDNNALARQVVIQDGRFYIDNPYISPNGDGEADTVQVVFRLDYPAGSELAIASEQGRLVRTIPLTDSANGTVSWDGRNDFGGVVADGRYALSLKVGGATLAMASVVVDNNRASLTGALLDERRGYLRNLTCAWGNDPFSRVGWALSEDEQALFFDKNNEESYPGLVNGIYRAGLGDWTPRRIVALEAFPGGEEIHFLARNRAGDRLVFVVENDNRSVDVYEQHLDGPVPATLLMSFGNADVSGVVYGADDRTVFLLSQADQIVLYNATTGIELETFVPVEGETYDGASMRANQDHSRVLINFWDGYDVIERQIIALFDTVNRTTSVVVDYHSSPLSVALAGAPLADAPFTGASLTDAARTVAATFCQEEQECDGSSPLSAPIEPVWSPDGRRFALSGATRFVTVHDTAGSVIGRYPLKALAPGTSKMFSSLSWSADASRLAFFYGGGQSWSAQAGYLYSLDLESGETRELYPYYQIILPSLMAASVNDTGPLSPDGVIERVGTLTWLPSDDVLLHQASNGDYIIPVSGSDAPRYIRDDIDLGGEARLSPRRRSLLFSQDPPEGTCNLSEWDGDVSQLYALDTLDNLTVNLRVLRSAGSPGFLISGTVTDAHFDRFTLMYSATGNGGWRPIRPPGTRRYVDETITTWLPPALGRYFVRLTGYDKAGNRLSAIKQVVWSDTAPISDVYLDQEQFSPNGDGILDDLGIHFRVREPVNLVARVYRGDTLVRTFNGAYDEIGREVWVRWDGRDENGQQVPDGEYRVVVQGAEYRLNVDNTYPDLALGMSAEPFRKGCVNQESFNETASATQNPGQQCRASYRGKTTFLQLDYRLNAHLGSVDEPGIEIIIESSPVGETLWTLYGRRRLDTFEQRSGWWLPLDEAEIVNRKFRASARDSAGNETVVEYRPAHVGLATLLRAGPFQPADDLARIMGVEFSNLGGPIGFGSAAPNPVFGPVDRVDGDAHFTLSETLPERVIAVYAEHGELQGNAWNRHLVSRFLEADWQECHRHPGDCQPRVSDRIAEGRIHVLWDMSPITGHANQALRFVLKTATGEEITTPEVRVHTTPFEIEGLGFSRLTVPRTKVLAGTIHVPERMERLDLYLQSDRDGRYDTVQWLGSVPPSPTKKVAANTLRFEIDASNIMRCIEYQVLAVMTMKDGTRSELSATLIDPCLKALYRVDYSETLRQQPASQTVALTVWPVTLSEAPLQSLEVFAPLDDGGRDVIVTATSPANEQPLHFDLDTSAWPPGDVQLGLRLVDESGDESITRFQVYKDTAPPAVELAYPLPGDTVCGRQPFQFSYLDTAGPLGAGSVPRGWRHQDRIHAYIDMGGRGTDSLSGKRPSRFGGTVLPTASAARLAAQNLDVPGNQPFLPASGLLGEDLFAEMLVDVLNAKGESLQRISLWDRSADGAGMTGPQGVDRRLVYRDSITMPWALAGSDEPAENVLLRVVGSDAYGNYSVLERRLTLDAVASAPRLRVDNGTGIQGEGATAYLSPNGDGVLDGLEVSLANREAGELEVRLYTAAVDANPRVPPLGVVYRNEAALSGDIQFHWDGTLNGAVVADGRYRLVAVLRDACGNISAVAPEAGPMIVIDTQAPLLNNVRPQAGAPLALLGHLRADVSDQNLDEQRVSVHYRLAGSGTEVALPRKLNQLEDDGGHRVRADWNTYGLAGAYDLIWRAVDRAGNERRRVIPVSLLEKADLLSSLDVDAAYVSPNGDGRQDRLRYHLGVLEPVTATIILQTRSGTEVIELHRGDLAPGMHTLQWGTNLASGLVSDGDYRIEVTARSIEFPSLEQVVARDFTVDRLPPAIQTPSLSGGFLQAPFALTVAIDDDALREYRVALASEAGTEVLAQGHRRLPESRLRTLEAAPEGRYTLHAEAYDLAGNTVLIERPFTLDRTDPSLTWITPASNLLGGENANVLAWSLQIEEPNPGALRIFLVPENGDPIPLHEAHGASGRVEGEADIEALNGPFVLTAVASDLAGNEARVEKSLGIDHRAPEIAVTDPAEGAYLTGPFPVTADIQDNNLEHWTLSLEEAGSGAVIELDSGGAASTGLLGDYPVPADGQYSLILRAEDAVGYRREARSGVVVDTTPPAAPSELAVQPLGDRHRLAWRASDAPDVAHYRILDKGQAFGETDTVTAFEFEAVANRPYQFTVVAVDRAGLASEPSAPLSWSLDTLGPTVSLQQPLAGARVSALVDVIGTVYSNDLAAYSLAVSPAGAVENWRTLISASLPRRAERLGQWNTLDGAGDGDYRIRLRGVDHTGNVAIATVAVQVDNTAPEAPISLQAHAEEGDVTLTWGASPAADVAGYLLTRNDRIVNAEGSVVGGITPYLLNDGPYLDADVADGRHLYAVYAVDRSGNVSQPASTDITLDRRAPVLQWLSPEPGGAFEQSLLLQVASPDEDLIGVRFRYRGAGDPDWTELAPDSDDPPYLYGWDTRALPYGEYELQAQTWDEGGRDALSAIRTVRKQDLTPPLPPSAMTARVRGNAVTLTWLPSASEDAAAHRLVLVDEQGETHDLGSAPAPQNTLTVPDLDDGEYRFELRAIDTAGNESVNAEHASALVFTPELDDIDPLVADAVVSLAGSVPSGQTVRLFRIVEGQPESPVSGPVDTARRFAFKNVPLDSGPNQFAVQALYGEDNLSNPAFVTLIRTVPPGKVRELKRDASLESGDQQAVLTWRPPLDAPQAYYLVRDDHGKLLLDEDPIAPERYETASSFPSYAPLNDAFDGNPRTDFISYDRNWAIDVAYAPGTWITGVDLQWGWSTPISVRLLGRIAGAWRLLAQANNEDFVDNQWHPRPDTPWPVTALRLEVSASEGAALAEWVALAGEVRQDTFFDYQGTAKKEKTFRVSAVNQYGLEGEAESLSTRLGDWLAPEAVVLSATAQGNEVWLEWTPSASNDVVAYLVYRDGQPLARVDSPGATISAYQDGPVANGTHPYQVRPLDAAGNIGAYSNLALATVSMAPPPSPGNVEPSADPTTGCIDLSWQASEGASQYRILRGENAGAFEPIATVAQTWYTDCDVYPRIDYRYRIIAVDAAGNGGGPSPETPPVPAEDSVPPAAPVISRPVPEGSHYRARGDTITVGGRAEHGTTVVLLRDGYPVAETQAMERPPGAPSRYQSLDAWALRLSPEGSHLAVLDNDGDVELLAWPTGQPLRELEPDSYVAWINDHRFATVRADNASLVIETGLATQDTTRALTTVSDNGQVDVREWYYHRGLKKLVVVAEYYLAGMVRVSLVDPETGADTLVFSADEDDVDTIKLSPSGQRLLWGEGDTFHQYDRVTKSNTPVMCPGWGIGWTEAPEEPVLAGSQGVLRCHDGGVATPLLENPEPPLGINDRGGLPDGVQFLFWRHTGPGRTEVKAFNGRDIIRIGEISHAPDKALFVEGFLPDYRIWFTYAIDDDPNALGVELGTVDTNFSFPDTLLKPGLNTFSVVARDRFGNQGEHSGQVRIEGQPAPFANLAMSLTVPQAAAQGDAVPVTVVITNTGNTDVAATAIQVMAREADGSLTVLLDRPVPAMKQGAMHTWRLDWSPTASGTAIIEAALDPQRRLNETRTGDNQAVARIPITAERAVALVLPEAPVTGKPGESRYLDWTLVNPGARTYQGELVLSALTASGAHREVLTRVTAPSTPATGASSGRLMFNIPDLLPGQYRLRLEFVASALDQPVFDEAALRVQTDVRLVATLSGPSRHFTAHQDVAVNVDLAHVGVSGALSSAHWRAQVLAAGGTQVAGWEEPLSTLLPGDHQRRAFSWNTGATPPGDYQFRFALRDGNGNTLLEKTYAFTIDAGVPVLSGALAPVSDTVGQGRPLAVGWSLENSGNIALAAIEASIEARGEGRAPLLLWSGTLSLAVGATATGAPSLSTAGLPLGVTRLALVARISLNGAVYQETLATRTIEVRDIEPPELSVIAPRNGAVINAGNSLLIARARDATSTLASAQWRADGGAWWDMAMYGNEFRAALARLANGAHVLEVVAIDSAGNRSQPVPVSVIVDNTPADTQPPEIVISGVQEGGYYAGPISLQVEIEDQSPLVATEILLNGVPYSPGSAIRSEGFYRLVVTAEDEPGYKARRETAFTIDTQVPRIQITGVEEGGRYRTPVTPMITIEDVSPLEKTLTLNGEPYVEGTPISQEGDYRLSVQARDPLAHGAAVTIAFVLDFTAPPAPVIQHPRPGDRLHGPDIEIVGEAEPRARVDITVGAIEQVVWTDDQGVFAWPVSLEAGEQRLQAVAVDAAGNRGPVTTLVFEVVGTEIVIDTDTPRQRRAVLLWRLHHAGHHDPAPGGYAAMLERLGMPFTVVDRETDFRDALASERYRVVMLIGSGSHFGGPFTIGADTLMRLRGAVASGYGLLWIDTRPDLLETWHDLMGARGVLPLTRLDSLVYRLDDDAALTLDYHGPAVAVTVLDGEGQGSLRPDCYLALPFLCPGMGWGAAPYPSAVVNEYGRGTTKLLTFDPRDLPAPMDAQAILADLLADVMPLAPIALHWVPEPLAMVVSRDRATVPLTVTLSASAGVRLLPGGQAESIDSSSARWTLPVGDLSRRLSCRLLAERPGVHSVQVRITNTETGQVLEQQTHPFEVARSDQQRMETLRQAIRAELESHPWNFLLHEARYFFEASVRAYQHGRYRSGYAQLYWAMLKLRLMPNYNKNLMALMGDYQRLLISRDREF